VRKFTRKAREYKVVYREQFRSFADAAAADDADAAAADEAPARPPKLPQKHHYSLIEKQVKSLKAHRCSLDTDFKFIKNS
jgi:hypothetical protein